MRLVVDKDRCQGHGKCYMNQPDLFRPDEEGFATVVREAIDGEQLAGARQAVLSCPEGALDLLEI